MNITWGEATRPRMQSRLGVWKQEKQHQSDVRSKVRIKHQDTHVTAWEKKLLHDC